MRKVIVFGDLPIATKIVQYLESLREVEIGVVIGNDNPNNHDPWENIPLLKDYVLEKGIKQYTLEELTDTYDKGGLCLGLSCRYSKIIKKPVIDLFKNGIINMHGGLLPEFAGLCSVNYTLLCGSIYGGGTLHYIDEGVDTGNIIRRCEFLINKNDIAFSVFQKTQIELEKNMEEIIPVALNGILKTKSIADYVKEGHESHYFNKKHLDEDKRIVDLDLNKEEVQRTIRAFDFPDYEPAYTVDSNGNKVYLRYSK